MKTSITQTRLSSQTLDCIDRIAAIIGEDHPEMEILITEALVQIGTLGYQDALIDASERALSEPDTFPGNLNWSDTNGQAGSEVL